MVVKLPIEGEVQVRLRIYAAPTFLRNLFSTRKRKPRKPLCGTHGEN
jgi:hypothetical protein